jgi:hypothetical protein
MKHVQLIIASIQTVLLAVLVAFAVRISRQLPVQRAPTMGEYQAARSDFKMRSAVESRIPLVGVNNWPRALEGVETMEVDVRNWPDAFAGIIPLPVAIRNEPLSVNVENLPPTLDVRVVR